MKIYKAFQKNIFLYERFEYFTNHSQLFRVQS